jgi:hypothetical protein
VTATMPLDVEIPRTLDALMDRLAAERPTGEVEAWLFETAPARRAAEARLATLGIRARFRSAFKPLLCFFLEEVDRTALSRATIHYPRHPLAAPGRFLAECYPLAASLEGVDTHFVPGKEGLTYEVALEWRDGGKTNHVVFAPNAEREGALGVCGWLRRDEGEERLPTEFEAIFDAALDTVRRQGWSGESPAFERLTFTVALPAADEPIGWGQEVISFRELLHEELLFATREILGAGANRLACPGQILPDIRGSGGPARLSVSTVAFDGPDETAGEDIPLATADRPLAMAQIRAALTALGGVGFSALSVEGRSVMGLHRPGTLPPLLLSSGQHANETSGVVGALRAAEVLLRNPAVDLAFIPVENVDGYELHQRLIRHNPHHMHHAARFNAQGDDISRGSHPSLHERRARQEAVARSGATLHINLHGYPSHEWVRPLTGYLPKAFEDWSMPKGFFLILVYHDGWRDAAEAMLDRVTVRLAEDGDLVAFNRRQIDAALAHSEPPPFAVRNGIAYFLSQGDDYAAPLTIITEAPDETIYGPDFVFQQQTQFRAALICAEEWHSLGGRPAAGA